MVVATGYPVIIVMMVVMAGKMQTEVCIVPMVWFMKSSCFIAGAKKRKEEQVKKPFRVFIGFFYGNLDVLVKVFVGAYALRTNRAISGGSSGRKTVLQSKHFRETNRCKYCLRA